MKKFIIVFLITYLTVPALWAVDLIPKIGIDIPGTVNYDPIPDYLDNQINKNRGTKRGYNMALETRADISRFFSWGAGIEYATNRGIENEEKSDFSFVPIYISMLYSPFGNKYSVKPYAKISGGYNVLALNAADDSTQGRLYWGGGIGFEYKKIVFEFFTSQYFADLQDSKSSMKYTKMGFTLGYKINLDKIFKSSQEQE